MSAVTMLPSKSSTTSVRCQPTLADSADTTFSATTALCYLDHLPYLRGPGLTGTDRLLFPNQQMQTMLVGNMFFERPEIKDQLPPLQFRQPAKGRHATVRVPVGDFPKENPVALTLNNRQLEIRCMFLDETTAIASVTLNAITLE